MAAFTAWNDSPSNCLHVHFVRKDGPNSNVLVIPGRASGEVAVTTYQGRAPLTNILLTAIINIDVNNVGGIFFDRTNDAQFRSAVLKTALHEIGHTMGLGEEPFNRELQCGGQTAGKTVMNGMCGINDSANLSPTNVQPCDTQTVNQNPQCSTSTSAPGTAPYQCVANQNTQMSFDEYIATRSQCSATWDYDVCTCSSNEPCGLTQEQFTSASDDCAIQGGSFTNCSCHTGGGHHCEPDYNCQFGWDPDTCACYEDPCPIVVDTEGEGFHLTSAASGVLFDINANSMQEQVSWTNSAFHNAFLVLDRNDNGQVDNGTELFGNFTPQPPSPLKNGFLALAEYDKAENGGNGDGLIDSHDGIFASLRLWIDLDHNGISEPEELFTLPGRGVYSISLDYREARRRDAFGNQFRYRTKMNVGLSTETWVYDVFLLLAPPQSARLAWPSRVQSVDFDRRLLRTLRSSWR